MHQLPRPQRVHGFLAGCITSTCSESTSDRALSRGGGVVAFLDENMVGQLLLLHYSLEKTTSPTSNEREEETARVHRSGPASVVAASPCLPSSHWEQQRRMDPPIKWVQSVGKDPQEAEGLLLVLLRLLVLRDVDESRHRISSWWGWRQVFFLLNLPRRSYASCFRQVSFSSIVLF
ncbi:hypothetical protein OPV22_015821 [Ensete ventricosum]|uniref:Uncharacterized protein n=1 Tax=Ensete ventricosum TaxID=4639 RepID=A0AAV8R4Q1_ENSVE|nr:hypothetical protein OPV22_015821 [Ensete ventricosum]